MNKADSDVGALADARWVWDGGAPARLTRARFRREVTLASAPQLAALTLSARTRYRLQVNGVALGGGPGRSYPGFREADEHDLAPLLRVGENVIEVEALHEAFGTFHHLSEPPGFIAWGAIVESGGARHALATPGAWLCRRRAGVAEHAPRLSFAQNSVEILNLAAEADNPAPWRAPAPAAPGATPALLPRRIPRLTRLPLAGRAVRAAPAAEEEMRGTCCALDDDGPRPVAGSARDYRFCARGWLFSPRAQTVRFGSWWGNYWLDGHALKKVNDASHPLRQVMEARLTPGWHLLGAVGEVSFGYWDFCLAWPRAAGLLLRATPRADAPDGFEIGGPAPRAQVEAAGAALFEAAAPSLVAWRGVTAETAAASPLRRLAWSGPDGAMEPVEYPVCLADAAPALIEVDMERITLGRIALEIEATAGTVVEIGHAEQATADGRHDYGNAVVNHCADRFVLAGGRQRLETFDPRGFRHFEILIRNHRGPAILHAAGAVETRYPYQFTGAFRCSDPDFNRLWDYGRRTLELCSDDVLVDCPWRERTLYGGDLLAEMGGTVALTRDLRLVRRSLEVLLQSQNPADGWLGSRAPCEIKGGGLGDYPLLTAIATAWLTRWPEQADFAARAWPVCARLGRAVLGARRGDGLYAPPHGSFIDHGRHLTHGPLAAFNAAVVAGLRAMAEIGRKAGAASGAVTPLEAAATDLEGRLEAAYFDAPAAIFRDLPAEADKARVTEGSPAIVWPLLFAPATRRLAPAVLPALRQILAAFAPEHEHASVSPYQMFYLLALLRQLGEAELAEQTIRRVYAAMLARPTGTLWEHALPNQSLAHAWSCAVNDYCASAILGVRLGFESADELATVLVRPCAAALSWARGVTPHPLGDVAVAWRRDGERLLIKVQAPPGVPVEARPAGPLAALETVVERSDGAAARATPNGPHGN